MEWKKKNERKIHKIRQNKKTHYQTTKMKKRVKTEQNSAEYSGAVLVHLRITSLTPVAAINSIA